MRAWVAGGSGVRCPAGYSDLCGREAHRQRLEPAQRDGVAVVRWLGAPELEVRKPLEEFAQRDLALEPRQRVPEAVMRASAEAQVTAIGSRAVQPVRVLEPLRVPVRRAEQEEQTPSLRDAMATVLHVLARHPRG